MPGNILMFLLLLAYVLFFLIQTHSFMMLGACDCDRRRCIHGFIIWGILKRICIVLFLVLYLDLNILIEILIGSIPTIIMFLIVLIQWIRGEL